MKTLSLKNVLTLFLIILIGGAPQILCAQNTPDNLREQYLTPSEDILEEVMSPRYENIISLSDLSPNKEYFIHYSLNGLKGLSPIVDYAKKWYNLGGLQIDPKANRNRTFTTQMPSSSSMRTADGFEFIDAKTGSKKPVQTPKNAHLSHAKWSPDGSEIAYFAHFEDATHIYIANMSNGKSTRLTKEPVLATLNTTFEWSADSKYIFTVLVPKKRGPEPQEPKVDLPQIRMTTADENRVPTYKTLLEGTTEADLLEYYITGQFARINVSNKRVRTIGEPAMIRNIDVAPSGEYSIVESLQKPFSYIVPVYAFAWTKEIWDLDGKALTTLQKSEASTRIPDHKPVEDFGRSTITWRPDGEGLSMILKPQKEEENADSTQTTEKENNKEYQVVKWIPPFNEGSEEVLYTSKTNILSVSYTEESELFFVKESKSKNKEQLLAVYPDSSYSIYTYNTEDFYKNPGRLVTKTGNMGIPVVQLSSDEKSVFFSGMQYDENPQEQSPRLFIDRVEIQTAEKSQVYQSPADVYESFTAVLDDDFNEIVVSRQSAEMYPDSWLVNLNSDNTAKLTNNKDYNTAISQAPRKRFKVQRADGFEFWVEVILPQNWDGKPLPALIWHYPREYDDQEAYDKSQRRFNKNTYSRVQHGWPQRDVEIFTKKGYAVVKADWPISSERGTPNDGFIWSVQQNSTVVIDSITAKGYVDRERIAIGGHSYGAFGTVHAMIQTSFFKAGIAGNGAYNRTLTPMGFQRERSDLWRAQSRYLQMSPIFWADRLDGALLMYHGADDQNTGTWPENSWRMFHALNAMGKPASMHMYPYSAHHTGAKEIVFDRWTRWVEWLDHYVKDKGELIPENEMGK